MIDDEVEGALGYPAQAQKICLSHRCLRLIVHVNVHSRPTTANINLLIVHVPWLALCVLGLTENSTAFIVCAS